jgi:hypothetical protein
LKPALSAVGIYHDGTAVARSMPIFGSIPKMGSRERH